MIVSACWPAGGPINQMESFAQVHNRLAAMHGYSPLSECPACADLTRFFSETMVCGRHGGAMSAVLVFDRLEAMDARTGRIEAGVDRVERVLMRMETALKAGAVGAWGNPADGRDG